MKPPMAYYGAKGKLATWLADMLPEHRVYVEPFCGSCAVLLAKTPAAHEVVSDIDDNLVTFLRVLRDQPEDLVRVCSLTPYARAEFIACEQRDGQGDLERARRTWVRIEQAYSGATGASHRMSWSQSVTRSGAVASGAQSKVERMHEVAARLVRVIIDNRGAFDAIERYAVTDDTVIYCDPPYLAKTRRRNRTGTRKPEGDSNRCADYAHDFSTVEDHRALADVLHATPATVLLSGYLSPLYDELYGDWTRVERLVMSNAGTNKGTNKGTTGVRRIEAVWCNRPIGAQLRLLDMQDAPFCDACLFRHHPGQNTLCGSAV